MVMMKHKMLSDLILVLLIMASCCHAETSKQKLDVKKHLKSFNKPSLKSIKSPDGDIIDCVDISKQPAFDHPSLKNHTIQMRPKYHPEGLFKENKMTFLKTRKNGPKGVTQLWHNSGRCPEGTIPIRRTKEEDVLRTSSIKKYGKKKFKNVPKPKSADLDIITQSGHQHAIAFVTGDQYYGTKATINVWKPEVQEPNEFSLTQIWILGGSFDSDLNSLEAGWHVDPELYGNNNTRLFTYWTSDSYQATGCYNLLCSGFIQTSNEIALGGSISPLSGYHGSQYDITILVWKDPNGGNWWMQYGNDHVLGYWPGSLFSYLVESASIIEWGGEVTNTKSDGQHTTTQMGSGHFSVEGFGKASYIRNIQIVDASNNLRVPEKLGTFTEQSDCYDIQLGKNDNQWGSHFFFGGPGRNQKCP